MGFNFILPLRIAQGVLALIVLGLSAYYTTFLRNTTYAGGPFLLFCSIWTFLALGYLVAAPLWIQAIHNMWAVLGVEIATTLLWFIGFIVAASEFPGMLCDNFDGTGSYNCPGLGSGKGATALGAFEWALFVATLVLCIVEIVRHKKGRGGDGEMAGDMQYDAGYPGVDWT
ncbi:membrane-associating domain-containing protein [Geopyxis carbonaria]|nr:membrane-associating domain-containing protein [Geopyxis carbonaria]